MTSITGLAGLPDLRAARALIGNTPSGPVTPLTEEQMKIKGKDPEFVAKLQADHAQSEAAWDAWKVANGFAAQAAAGADPGSVMSPREGLLAYLMTTKLWSAPDGPGAGLDGNPLPGRQMSKV
jgi:hypothetical protein